MWSVCLALVRALSVVQRNPLDFLPRFPMAGRGIPGLCRPHVRYPYRAVNRRIQNIKRRHQPLVLSDKRLLSYLACG